MEESKNIKPSKYEIVNKVMTLLKIGDYGKVENFVQKTISALEREIETAERSINNAKHNHSNQLIEDNEKLEDAIADVENAYTDIDPEKLKSNKDHSDFMETYLESISKAEGIVLGIEEKIERDKKSLDKAIEKLQDQIDIRKKRIKRLTEGVTN